MTTQHAQYGAGSPAFPVAVKTIYRNLAATTASEGGNVQTKSSNGALGAGHNGVTPNEGDVVALLDGAASIRNGFYTVTSLGDGSNAFILTRLSGFEAGTRFDGGSFPFLVEASAGYEVWALIAGTPAILGTSTVGGRAVGMGRLGLSRGIDQSGTPGAVTATGYGHGLCAINTGAASVTVTHADVRAGDSVQAVVAQAAADATCLRVERVAVTDGSFTIYGTASATAPTVVSWRLARDPANI